MQILDDPTLRLINKISQNKNGSIHPDFEHWVEIVFGKIGATSAKMLGHGAYGIAVLLDNGKVLKITTDLSEIETCAYIKGKDLKYIQRVYSVFKAKKFNMGFILTDKYDEWPQSMSMFDSVRIALYASSTTPSDDCTDKEFSKIVYRSVLKNAGVPLNDTEINELIDAAYEVTTGYRISEEEYELELKYGIQLFCALKVLEENKVDFGDLHDGNVMIDQNNDVVIIDLGLSYSPGNQSQIDIIESYNSENR